MQTIALKICIKENFYEINALYALKTKKHSGAHGLIIYFVEKC